MAIGWRVTTARRKTIVRPARRMFNAISLGVFWRSAPSTSLIIRSRNVSPGFELIRTLISSESTRVPPVTADRSPPDSRMTGADSPVIADSSTEATPSTTSPSPGINSPAATITRSPDRSFDPGTVSVEPSGRSRRAMVSARALRKASACALPRPSAMASAKFANRTVNQSHRVICSEKPNPGTWRARFHTSATVVVAAPTSTTNITGFFISVRGLSFKAESQTARPTIPEVQRDFIASFDLSFMMVSKRLPRVHQQVLQNRTQAERREESQRTYNQNHRTQQHCEQRRRHRERARGRGYELLARQVASNGQNGNHRKEAAQQSGKADRRVIPKRIRVDSGESRTVVSCCGGVGIQDL